MNTSLNTYRQKILFDATGLINSASDARQLALIEYAILSAKADMDSGEFSEIPTELFTQLMQQSEAQAQSGDFISQNEMERLVASW